MYSDNKKLGIFSILLSFFVAAYWLIVAHLEVYKFALTGAIYEILWLPMLACLFGLPIFSLILLIRERFNKNSLHYFPLIVLLFLMAYLYLK